MKVLAQLFFSFFKTGLFTFGGGYAMLPLLKEETVEKRGWLKEDELINYYSLGQCTPGIIAVNVATLCGYKLRKSLGAIVATTALVLPSLIIIILIASLLKQVMHFAALQHILGGIKIGVTALLCSIVYDLCKKTYTQSTRKIFPLCLFVLSLILLLCFHLSAVVIILCAFIFCLIIFVFKRRHDIS